ncbi:hypothetical protein AG1IA_06225 [Rhizoctonia solani AG-1 IA]|uniref:Uncharacterized protein n=1 Tax=Thanatephorus cucumeris (strain AG1-IA) TaxID=983506 RepID=L8WTT4_THACA|nr:hypothetical protein AG1IA_06225 [Rhizoctonia solani AG-1 IA]
MLMSTPISDVAAATQQPLASILIGDVAQYSISYRRSCRVQVGSGCCGFSLVQRVERSPDTEKYETEIRLERYSRRLPFTVNDTCLCQMQNQVSRNTQLEQTPVAVDGGRPQWSISIQPLTQPNSTIRTSQALSRATTALAQAVIRYTSYYSHPQLRTFLDTLFGTSFPAYALCPSKVRLTSPYTTRLYIK